MKKLNQLIKENLNVSIKKFINEETNNSNMLNAFITEFSNNLENYFDNEKQKLIRRIKFGKNMKNKVLEFNDLIMNLGYNFSKIETDENNGDYNINYIISDSENWNEDEIMNYENEINSNFEDNDYDIDVKLEENMYGGFMITMSFSINILKEIDV